MLLAESRDYDFLQTRRIFGRKSEFLIDLYQKKGIKGLRKELLGCIVKGDGVALVVLC